MNQKIFQHDSPPRFLRPPLRPAASLKNENRCMN